MYNRNFKTKLTFSGGYDCKLLNLHLTQNSTVDKVNLKVDDFENIVTFSVEDRNASFLPTFKNGLIEELFPNIVTYYIYGIIQNPNFPKSLERKNFREFKKINQLFIINCNLEYMNGDLFWDLKDILTFNLGGNKIRILPQDLLQESKKLLFFLLQENRLEEIPPGFFQNNPNLRELDLSDNNLKKLNGNLEIINVEVLKLSNNVCIDRDASDGNPRYVSEMTVYARHHC